VLAMDHIDFGTSSPVSGDLDVSWIHGALSPRHTLDPPLQVHRRDEHTYILRQSKALHYEAPFLFLMFGNDRAILFDTGATGDLQAFPLRRIVDRLVSGWLRDHPRADYSLVVAHSHGHGDHVAADQQFADRPLTTVVGRDADAVRAFFGFAAWPEEIVSFDLGGRILEVTGIPGHHAASIGVFDPWTGFLLTGDTVYPGRLYVQDMPAFLDSLDRLVDMATTRPVTYVLGCHIEMSRQPGRDYPMGSTYQPDEPPLELSVEQLAAVRTAARGIADRPGPHWFDDFVIFNGPCTLEVVRQLARSRWGGMRNELRRRRSPRAGTSPSGSCW
jgi:hydroxyacylglutathione hydrolase